MKKSALICAFCLAGEVLLAAEFSSTNDLFCLLRGVPAPELPRVAAEFVKLAGATNQIAVAREIVKVAIQLNPAATVALVGAVARGNPEIAAVVSESAARERPDFVANIARAAAVSAPACAGQIVAAVCNVVPTEYYNIALAVVRAVPAESGSILRGVAQARADLRPFLERELATQPRTIRSVARCLERAERARALATGVRQSGGTNAGATPQGSPHPRPSPPGQGGPPRGNGDPPGGRNYARP